MDHSRARFIVFALFISFLLFPMFVNPVLASHDGGWDDTTQASNKNSIANTRHNLSVAYSNKRLDMEQAKNDYDRVCVYCHTPHGSNSTMPLAPLWNRTNQVAMGTEYDLYTSAGTLLSGQSATEPGVNSITCLSCHDGTLAIDSIINMPGSGGYDPAQETSQNEDFLDSWVQPSGDQGEVHVGLGLCASSCHKTGGLFGFDPDFPNFGAFLIGTDLTNDHPIGVLMPDAVIYGFNEPDTSNAEATMKFFDGDDDGHADRSEIRLYDTGDGYEVECASCHDPHGVVKTGSSLGDLIPSFLRVDNNDGSAVCLTCHVK